VGIRGERANCLHAGADLGCRTWPGAKDVEILNATEMIGTTRSRVSFFMNKFRRLGFVDDNGGGLEVHSSLLNVVLHD
jgi:hypothetical protein